MLNLCLFFPPAILNWKDTARVKAIFYWEILSLLIPAVEHCGPATSTETQNHDLLQTDSSPVITQGSACAIMPLLVLDVCTSSSSSIAA